MKRLLILFLLLFLGVGLFFERKPITAFALQQLYRSACDTPIHYRLGVVDARFNISNAQVLEDISKANEIWSSSYGKQLFVPDPNAKFTISMLYDERQRLTTEINQRGSNLSNEKNQLQPQMEEYQKKVTDFKTRVASLNEEIHYWNTRGGAPEDVYQKLKNEQESLQQEAQSLNALAKSLNQSASQYNGEVQQLDQTIYTFNTTLKYKPEEGTYVFDKNGERIEIYFNTSSTELIHTLAHELGHALGMQHVPSDNSIMFAQSNTITTPSPEDLGELTLVCKKENVLIQEYKNITLSIRSLIVPLSMRETVR